MLIADDLDKLLHVLPGFVKNPLNQHPSKKLLIEVVMDLGRRPEARFPGGPEYLSISNISWNDLDFCIKKIPQFSGDNRSGIECTLHRISSIKNRKGNIIGLTFRVGRAIFGTVSHVRDLLYTGSSILLLGKPGVGKTTVIREITRVLADEMEKRVVIIDTSNEIAGDGDIPHPAIGRARRMQVVRPELQHEVMIEAVENHMPEVIIIDEIGTELEAVAARTIAERGVQLVGTAHGNYLHSVIKNPTLCDLIGGIQYVTLGDDEAKRRGSQKSVLERKSIPAFQIAIEIHKRDSWIIHEKVDQVVDEILQGSVIALQRRKFNCDTSISIRCENSSFTEFNTYKNNYINNKTISVSSSTVKDDSPIYTSQLSLANSFYSLNNTDAHLVNNQKSYNNSKIAKLYVYSLNMQQVELVIENLSLPILLTRDLLKADYVLALRSCLQYNNKIRQTAKSRQIVIYTIHNNSINNIRRALKQMLNTQKISLIAWRKICLDKTFNELNALTETRYAIENIVLFYRESVELLPRSHGLRELQSSLISLYNLKYSASDKRGNQKLIIYPN
uniref:AAA+ ATPase domain-containing protein n=1 Tax=Pleurostichidium falkenbergii TaxID=121064 RepID=A0A4D6UYZ5_9FLOR|nr:hypothetical protein [Pleurostichidium falkenbergii]QCH39683.1 hypothetical protein [Pleurostichidium falkenbergii]